MVVNGGEETGRNVSLRVFAKMLSFPLTCCTLVEN